MNNKSNNKHLVGKIMLLAISIFVILVLLLIFQPITNITESIKYSGLKEASGILYDKLKSSYPSDKWSYLPDCENEYSGSWPTGRYVCSTKINLEARLDSLEDINEIFLKTYSTIEKDENFPENTGLSVSPQNIFGERFAVSSAFKRYQYKNSGIICRYSIDVNQVYDDYTPQRRSYGKEIEGEGKLLFEFRCADFSIKDRY